MKQPGIIIGIVVLGSACTETYNPPVVSSSRVYLVVDGFIDNGSDSTVFTLSHSYPISDTSHTTPETGARVTVEGTDNSVQTLNETVSGHYAAILGVLNSSIRYRLHILTSDAREYRSDFVPVKTSPPIDSVNWTLDGNGLHIYANTHDPTGASIYYRWFYTETWQYHATYLADETYVPSTVTLLFNPNDSVYTCWYTDNSTNILLASSANLTHDVIYESPLVTIPFNSWEVGVEYSILVNQVVLTQEAYDFWVNMQRNTELMGNLFSPQPSEIGGNIHNIADSSEPVVGFISVSSLQKQRIFITPTELPNWVIEGYPEQCLYFSISGQRDSLKYYLGGFYYLPVTVDMTTGRLLISDNYCVDCRLVGGVTTKPSFWQ